MLKSDIEKFVGNPTDEKEKRFGGRRKAITTWRVK